MVEGRCPTFSWGHVEEAGSYELVVYRLAGETEETEPVLAETMPGSASSWTASLDQCLEPGARYAWAVRAVRGEDVSDWSSPSLFQVPSGPGQRYLDLGDGTVLDCNTGLIWLKDASCSDLAGTDASGKANWNTAQSAAANLADGACGLTDGSSVGDWRQPAAAEFCSAFAGSLLACPAGSASDSLIDSAVAGAPKASLLDGLIYVSHSGNFSYIWPVREGQ